jgi:hypothetical protein
MATAHDKSHSHLCSCIRKARSWGCAALSPSPHHAVCCAQPMPRVSTPKDLSPLVAAAATLDAELRGFDELAQEANRCVLTTEKGLTRATRALTQCVDQRGRIEEKLQSLLSEIDASRRRQQESADILVEVARNLEARGKERDELISRFGTLGESAARINLLALELGDLREQHGEQRVLEHLTDIQTQIAHIVSEARSLVESAERGGWAEIARQIDAVRQQMQASANKLAIAHRNVASRAPS